MKTVSSEEFDRVKELCSELNRITKIKCLTKGLILTRHISRKEYRMGYSNTKFIKDYSRALKPSCGSLDKKRCWSLTMSLTEGMTLRVISEKLLENFPKVILYGAAGAIIAKKRNVAPVAIKKFKRRVS